MECNTIQWKMYCIWNVMHSDSDSRVSGRRRTKLGLGCLGCRDAQVVPAWESAVRKPYNLWQPAWMWCYVEWNVVLFNEMKCNVKWNVMFDCEKLWKRRRTKLGLGDLGFPIHLQVAPSGQICFTTFLFISIYATTKDALLWYFSLFSDFFLFSKNDFLLQQVLCIWWPDAFDHHWSIGKKA